MKILSAILQEMSFYTNKEKYCRTPWTESKQDYHYQKKYNISKLNFDLKDKSTDKSKSTQS